MPMGVCYFTVITILDFGQVTVEVEMVATVNFERYSFSGLGLAKMIVGLRFASGCRPSFQEG